MQIRQAKKKIEIRNKQETNGTKLLTNEIYRWVFTVEQAHVMLKPTAAENVSPT